MKAPWSLHWSLDVTFREDDCRIRQGQAAENFALVRHVALSLLQQEKSLKVGIEAKRFNAALDPHCGINKKVSIHSLRHSA